MKFIYAVCLLVLLPATAAAAEPKWSFKAENMRGPGWDTASVQWPNPQYRGTLKIAITCTKPGSDGILAHLETGEHMEEENATIQLPLRYGGKIETIGVMIANTSLILLEYEAHIRFFDALLSPDLSIDVTDSTGRHVVTTAVPSRGAEEALRKLSCLSRYFYEYDQRPKEEPTPAAPATPVARCGDGFIQEGEVCDDGNTANDDGCSADCSVQHWSASCGDGVQHSGESCDDGNHSSSDTCEPDCTLPVRNWRVKP